MWTIIMLFGLIGGYVTRETNAKVSHLVYSIGFAAATMHMLIRADTVGNYYGGILYIIFAILLAILSVMSFIDFMKKL